MAERLDHARILIYSHDSFGLGHLRRCRSIAHSLVARFKGVSVLILSGSPIIGSFDFKARVDFVRIPGIIKLKGGEYISLGLHIDLEQTLSMRESIIYHTAESFKPDIFIVDKEPTGLQGEVVSTLKMLRDRGTINVLGLRDVMDEASALKAEWERKDVLPVLEALYHEIWIYGLSLMNNPVESIGLSKAVENKITRLAVVAYVNSQDLIDFILSFTLTFGINLRGCILNARKLKICFQISKLFSFRIFF